MGVGCFTNFEHVKVSLGCFHVSENTYILNGNSTATAMELLSLFRGTFSDVSRPNFFLRSCMSSLPIESFLSKDIQ